MRFLPVVDLWDAAIDAAVRNGQMKLQCGQWVRCGDDLLSRFIKTTPSCIYVVHPTGSGIETKRFSKCCKDWLARRVA